jgi:hypothetical protein
MPEFDKVIAELDQHGGLTLPEDYVQRVNAYMADLAEASAPITKLQETLAQRDARLNEVVAENQRLVRAIPAEPVIPPTAPAPKAEKPDTPQRFGLDRLREPRN